MSDISLMNLSSGIGCLFQNSLMSKSFMFSTFIKLLWLLLLCWALYFAKIVSLFRHYQLLHLGSKIIYILCLIGILNCFHKITKMQSSIEKVKCINHRRYFHGFPLKCKDAFIFCCYLQAGKSAGRLELYANEEKKIKTWGFPPLNRSVKKKNAFPPLNVIEKRV